MADDGVATGFCGIFAIEIDIPVIGTLVGGSVNGLLENSKGD